jgi:hypothetical protein
MNYHSDNDIGVQETIAAVSLGAPADMHFHRKGNPHCLRITLLHVSASLGRQDV